VVVARLRPGVAKRSRVWGWVEAGLAALAGALADDDPAAQHLRAAGIYAAIGNGTNRMLAVAAAAGARRTGGDPRLADVAAELADFAKRNAAERLLSW
jgi:aminopeptidase N